MLYRIGHAVASSKPYHQPRPNPKAASYTRCTSICKVGLTLLLLPATYRACRIPHFEGGAPQRVVPAAHVGQGTGRASGGVGGFADAPCLPGCAAAQVAHHFPEKPGHASALSGGLLRRRSPGATQCCHTFTMVHRCPPVRSPYGFPPWFWWRLKMLITAQSRQRAIGWVVHARCSAFGIGDPLLCPFPCGRVHARGSERCPSICSQISRLLGAAFGQCAEQWCA